MEKATTTEKKANVTMEDIKSILERKRERTLQIMIAMMEITQKRKS